MKKIIIIFLSLFEAYSAMSQQLNLAEKLGYPTDAKLLIIHADDAAVSHSTNQAVFDAFKKGFINSAAIMVPCPWFPEMAAFAVNYPDYDLGLHLTFTSEWNTYNWGGVAPSDEISSLLNNQGYFYQTTREAVRFSNPLEVDKELRAQINRALASGIHPSHFDTHMNTVFGNQELFEVYLKLGEDYKVPVLIPKDYKDLGDSLQIPETSATVLIDKVFEITPDILPADWNRYYTEILQTLTPGIYELIFHLAYNCDETRAMTMGHDYYEAEWRQRDVDYAMSDEFHKLLKENNIQLVTWRQIQKIMYP